MTMNRGAKSKTVDHGAVDETMEDRLVGAEPAEEMTTMAKLAERDTIAEQKKQGSQEALEEDQ